MRLLLPLLLLASPLFAAEPAKPDPFRKENLVAWCIVPFDSAKRGPKERVEMLQRLGFTQFAYDWRAEHLPSFPEEIELLKKAKISLKGVWFPAAVGKDGEFILETLKKHDVKTELWVMLPQPKGATQEEKVKESAKLVSELAKRAAKQDCKIGIYNHGGWTGEPENIVAVLKESGEKNVGIVYNMHHGHGHLSKLDEYLKLMQPHLYCVNLNGMEPKGDANGKKILVIGEGALEIEWLPLIKKQYSDITFGILGHTNDNAEDRLHDNLEGLKHWKDADPSKKDALRPAFRTSKGRDWRITLVKKDDKQVIEIDPLHNKDVVHFQIFVGSDFRNIETNKATPLLGTTTERDGKVIFTPRFLFESGMTYCVIAKSSARQSPTIRLIHFNEHDYYATFTIPKPVTAPPVVESVYPTATKLPENTLRMYLHFSAPMKQGTGHKYVTLTGADGKEVLDPFLKIDQELWSNDGKRLTLLFDPARVKRGLVPREEAGPILVEGKKFTFTIDPKWPDANGTPLKEGFKYSFEVGPPDDQPVTPAKWTITPPTQTGTVKVRFEKPLDKALAERMIWVVDAAGKRVELDAKAEPDQSGVTLGTGATAWKPGKYKLVVDTRLEDVCGNRVGEAFEVDEFKRVEKAIVAKYVELEFEVK